MKSPEAQRPFKTIGAGIGCPHPTLRDWKPIRTLFACCLNCFRLGSAMEIRRVEHNLRSTMIEHLNHLARVERHGLSAGQSPPTESTRLPPLRPQLALLQEQPGVIGHGEHAEVLHRPGLAVRQDALSFACAAVPDQHRVFAVQAWGQVRIAAAAENGRSTGVRVDQLQVVVEKAQRRTDREGVQPQRGLGQLDGHRGFVNAEDGFLQDHAAHDVAVVELGVGHGPTVAGGGLADAAADGGDAGDHRAFPGPAALHPVCRPGLAVDAVGGPAGGFEHPVGQVIDQRHQKVTTVHRRVADGQLQDLRGRVYRTTLAGLGTAVQPVPQRRRQRGALLPGLDLLVERGDALGRRPTDWRRIKRTKSSWVS